MVSDFRDLVCWQLSCALKCDVHAFTETGRAATDFKYRDQIRDSAASAPANISEGFVRFRPAEFAHYLRYARASLIETKNHLIDGRDRGFLDAALFSRLFNLAEAAVKATTHLMLSKHRLAAQNKAAARQTRRRR
jgi:four helix bundle protein